MTDYLELLLEWEQEDEEEYLAWRRRVVGYRQPLTEEEWEMVALRGGGTQGGEEKAGGMDMTAETARKRKTDPLTQLAELERAVRRVSGGAQEVQRKRQTGAQMEQAMSGKSIRRAEDMTAGMHRGLAGLLDAAFERDARRYDGALGLF